MITQLTDLAVRDRLPAYATDEDMYAALEVCGMTDEQVFDELERRFQGKADLLPAEMLATEIVIILFDQFDSALLTETAHKAM